MERYQINNPCQTYKLKMERYQINNPCQTYKCTGHIETDLLPSFGRFTFLRKKSMKYKKIIVFL